MNKRENQIIDLLLHFGELSVEQLSELLATSTSSIRRDLAGMSERRFVRRTHGGVILATAVDYAPGWPHRIQVDLMEARNIAAFAASQVVPGDIIGLSGGLICTHLSLHLRMLWRITIVTNAVNIAAEFANLPDLQVRMTGGSLNPGSYELVGPVLSASLKGVRLSKFFLGTDGISVQYGVTGHDEAEANAASVFMSHADETIVLADSAKFTKASFSQVAPLTSFKKVITTSQTPASSIKELEEAGLFVFVVPND